ncbi:copper homeostasis protein CutC [Arachidicoccus soli]|uniref:PF03932 family protein CutC n=1 Tax=Arachidicoccus soli TaxID=2341117 RepID=A0A386HTI9_9BACT|nr:copper homeostasis protein CutC [Arachidicoccus soli]AYD48992.1 copper homeostasis protein CutC [Arachidicoccus soli]
MLLEIAVFNIASALQAQSLGADRIELCENPLEGGTTPSFGTLKLVSEMIGIPVFPIVRPRGGDFLYNDEEYEVMKADLLLCKKMGFQGAVLGLLNMDGTIDVERTKKLVAAAYPLEITFHRAFDRARNPYESLEQVIETGCSRILTSGQQPNVSNACELIKKLIVQADERIIILPGSGVRSSNLPKMIETGAQEFHSSARKEKKSSMRFTVTSMAESLIHFGVDEEEIKKMKSILQSS